MSDDLSQLALLRRIRDAPYPLRRSNRTGRGCLHWQTVDALRRRGLVCCWQRSHDNDPRWEADFISLTHTGRALLSEDG